MDPRAKRLIADWMVSIPAVRKHPERAEYALYTNTGALGGVPDSEPQPSPFGDAFSAARRVVVSPQCKSPRASPAGEGLP